MQERHTVHALLRYASPNVPIVVLVNRPSINVGRDCPMPTWRCCGEHRLFFLGLHKALKFLDTRDTPTQAFGLCPCAGKRKSLSVTSECRLARAGLAVPLHAFYAPGPNQ